MKAFKIIGIILISIVLIAGVSGIFISKTVEIDRSIVIEASIEEVFPQVSLFENMHKWSPWKDYDPNMQTSYEGTDGEVGAIYRWAGNEDVGEGYQKITMIDPLTRIDLDLVFTAPWEAESKVYFTLKELDGRTQVNWGFTQATPFPMNIMMAVFGMKKNLSKDFDRGLSLLKDICEIDGV